MSIYKATYYPKGNQLIPEVVMYLSIQGRIVTTFRLSNEAQVKVLNSPKQELNGKLSCWGELKEKLSCLVDYSYDAKCEAWPNWPQNLKKDFEVEVSPIEMWLCGAEFVQNEIKALELKVSKRNRHIRRLKEQLATLSLETEKLVEV